MRTYQFMQVDAFTNAPTGGNPCAILFATDDLDDNTMYTIAGDTFETIHTRDDE